MFQAQNYREVPANLPRNFMAYLLAVISLVCSSLVMRGPTHGAIFLLCIFTMEQDTIILASMNFLELQSHQTNNLLGLIYSPGHLILIRKHINERF